MLIGRVDGALLRLGRLLGEARVGLARHSGVGSLLWVLLELEALGDSGLLCNFALLVNESQIAGRVDL